MFSIVFVSLAHGILRCHRCLASCRLHLYNFPVDLFRWRLLEMRTWCHQVYQYLIHDMLRNWQTWLLHCVTASLSSRWPMSLTKWSTQSLMVFRNRRLFQTQPYSIVCQLGLHWPCKRFLIKLTWTVKRRQHADVSSLFNQKYDSLLCFSPQIPSLVQSEMLKVERVSSPVTVKSPIVHHAVRSQCVWVVDRKTVFCGSRLFPVCKWLTAYLSLNN